MSDTFAPLTVRPRRAAGSAPTKSGLVVPDLDRPVPPPAADPIEVAAVAAQVAALAAARAEGFAAGAAAAEHAATTSRETAEATALAAIGTAMAGAAAAATAAIDEAAVALARLLLAALDVALPAAAARLAPETAARFAAELAPLLDADRRVTLRVAPGVADAAMARIGDPRLEIVEDATLAPGDASATWRGGGGISALADRRNAVAATLAALGLIEED